ncbi:MAG TPA: PAS domain-containing protein [Gillisia sp.]|nr:PAS domain-containing protein [Gillisia sp.]
MDSHTLSWTDEVYKIWGQQKSTFELNYKSFFQTIHPDDRETFQEEQSSSFKGEKVQDCIHRIILPDNTIKWVREIGRLVIDDKGNPIAFEGSVQDITALQEEEHRLKLLESVITNTHDAILITNAQPYGDSGNRIIYVNEAFTQMTGYTSEEIIGKTTQIMHGPKTDKEELNRLGKAIQNWEDCELTIIYYKKNGEEFWINFTHSPVANDKGIFTHWVTIQRDVTQQKQKEIEEHLLSKISFDFNVEYNLIASAKNLCKTISDYGRFALVELWSPNLEETEIRILAHRATTANVEEFYLKSKKVKCLKISQGLPGTVWEKKSPILWKDIRDNTDFLRKDAAKMAGIRTVLGIPLLFNKKVAGVMVIGTQHGINYLKKHLKIFGQLEGFIGSEISRKKLEDTLNHLYDSIPDILCVTNLQGKFLKINKASCDLLGYPEDEILYHNFDEFAHPEDKYIFSNEIGKLVGGCKNISFDNRYLTKKGEIIWLSWTCNSNKEEGVLYVSARNITSETKLKKLNRQASKLARIGSWEIDIVGNRLFWSDMVHELHETDPKAFTPQLDVAINFYRKDFHTKVKETVTNCVETGAPFDFEAVLITAKKNEIWVRAIGNAEFIDGKCIRIYGSFQDIHNRKEAEIRLQSLADNLPGVVFQYLIYPDGTDALKFVTKGSKEVWGFASEEVLQNNNLVWDQIIAGGDIATVQDSISKSIKFRNKWKGQWKYILPSGEIRTHLGFGSPNFLADGTVLFNSVILDISEEAKNKKLLEQATEMALIGSWELDIINQNGGDSMYWSPMTREILEVNSNYNPSLTGGFEYYSVESKERIQNAVEILIEEGKEFDEELLLITDSGKEKWIRCIGKSERILNKCLKIYGSFQDIHKSKSLDLQIREILSSISDAFYALNHNWEFTYFNRESEKLLLRNERDLIGKSIWEEFPAAIGTPLEEIYLRVSQTRQSESFEYLYPGDGKWYEINAYPSAGGISAYFKNIEDRKHAAEKLEKAYNEKTNILESIGDAFFSVNNDWIVTYWNKEAENVLGKKRDEILGKNLWEKYEDAINSDFYRQYHKALETQQNVNFEEYYATLNKWFEVTVYPSLSGLSVYFKDVTLRKEADIRLLQANERFEKVTEATSDAIWDWDIKNDTFFRSQGIENFFGKNTLKSLEADEFWSDKFSPQDLTGIRQSIDAAIQNPEVFRWEKEYRIIKEDEKTGYVHDKGIIVRDEMGKATRMVGAMTDITERKIFEHQLLELNKSLKQYSHELELTNEELEQFAFITSHDLQEPLRMITSFMDQLKRKYENQLDEKAIQYINFATDGAKRMKQIILDLLEYSRAGKIINSAEPVDLNELLEEYKILRRKIISEKSVKIKKGKFPTILTYKAPLTQTLHCILDNAIKYSKKADSPQIKISAKELADSWKISIEDNGIGIDPQFFEKIFIIFQRLHNRDQFGGTGIGLSVAKKNVESWGGKIWLESEPGEGSIFFFTIPKTN